MERSGLVNSLEEGTEKFRLFIAGLPVPLDLSEFTSYLTTFGTFRIDDNKYRKAMRRGQVKGYITVEAIDKESFERLSSVKKLTFQQRTLAIMPFKVGSRLERMNKTINNRRIIVKKVPICMPDEELTDTISDFYGAIEFYFQFQRYSCSKKKKSPGRYKTYSFIMESTDAAFEMTTSGSLLLPSGESILFLPYDASKKVENQSRKLEPSSKKILGNDTRGSKFNAIESNKGSANCMFRIGQAENQTGSLMGLRLGLNYNHLETVSEEGTSSAYFTLLSEGRIFLKPTYREYYLLNTRGHNYKEAMKLVHLRTISSSNLRFNVLAYPSRL